MRNTFQPSASSFCRRFSRGCHPATGSSQSSSTKALPLISRNEKVVTRHEMNEVFDSALEETAQRILPLAVTDILNREGDPGLERVLALKEHNEYLTYLVRNKSGRFLLQSHDAKRRF
jgi:hypothetical protein